MPRVTINNIFWHEIIEAEAEYLMLAVMSGASLCDTTSDVKKHNKILQQTCDALSLI